MESGEPKKFKFSVGYVILAFWIALLLQQVLTVYLHPDKLPYSDFKQAVAAGKIDDVAIGATNIHGHFKNEDEAAPAGANATTPPPAQPAQPATTPTARARARTPAVPSRMFDTVRVEDPEAAAAISTSTACASPASSSRRSGATPCPGCCRSPSWSGSGR